MNYNKKSYTERIIAIYQLTIDFVIIWSSVIFLTWFVLLFFNFDDPLIYFIAIIFPGFFFSNLYFFRTAVKKTSLEIKIFKFLNYLREAVKITGSFFVIFIFFNIFFKISPSLYSDFSPLWEKTENILGVVFAFVLFFFLVIPFFCFIILPVILQDLFKKLGKIIFIILFGIPLIIAITLSYKIIGSYFFLEKASWFLGFSLALIHFEYLVEKAKILFKKTLTLNNSGG